VLDDFCVSQLAQKLGNQSVYDSFSHSATFWENVWNPTVKFFCPRDTDGKWIQCNDPITWKYRSSYPFDSYYREGDGWQYRWYVSVRFTKCR
jgi:putative alpha-1,2-mannosidase